MNGAGSVHARRPGGSWRKGALAFLAGCFLGACEPIHPSERPTPPVSAPQSRELAREAEALVQVEGTVASDPVRGTHDLALKVVNGSRWTLTEVHVSVDADGPGEGEPKKHVLRSRGLVGPGQTEILEARLETDEAFGRPPTWRYEGAVGYPPRP
jgi:hypothetical protein